MGFAWFLKEVEENRENEVGFVLYRDRVLGLRDGRTREEAEVVDMACC